MVAFMNCCLSHRYWTICAGSPELRFICCNRPPTLHPPAFLDAAIKCLEDLGLLDPPAHNDATTSSPECRNDATTPSEEHRRQVGPPHTSPAPNNATTLLEEHRQQVGLVRVSIDWSWPSISTIMS